MSEAEPAKLHAGARVLVTTATNVEFVEMLQTCILNIVDKLVAYARISCTDNALLFASAGAGRSGGLETATPPVPTSSTLLIIWVIGRAWEDNLWPCIAETHQMLLVSDYTVWVLEQRFGGILPDCFSTAEVRSP